MLWPKKIHTRNLITKKNSRGSKISDSEKRVNKNTSDIPSIKRVTGKFLEVSRNSRAKQSQRNVQKSVLHVQSCFYA